MISGNSNDNDNDNLKKLKDKVKSVSLDHLGTEGGSYLPINVNPISVVESGSGIPFGYSRAYVSVSGAGVFDFIQNYVTQSKKLTKSEQKRIKILERKKALQKKREEKQRERDEKRRMRKWKIEKNRDERLFEYKKKQLIRKLNYILKNIKLVDKKHFTVNHKTILPLLNMRYCPDYSWDAGIVVIRYDTRERDVDVGVDKVVPELGYVFASGCSCDDASEYGFKYYEKDCKLSEKNIDEKIKIYDSNSSESESNNDFNIIKTLVDANKTGLDITFKTVPLTIDEFKKLVFDDSTDLIFFKVINDKVTEIYNELLNVKNNNKRK